MYIDTHSSPQSTVGDLKMCRCASHQQWGQDRLHPSQDHRLGTRLVSFRRKTRFPREK